jgi:hypothetical protein
MTLTWTIILAWLALQLPLGAIIGRSIRFGMRGAEMPVPGRYAKLHPAVVWC